MANNKHLRRLQKSVIAWNKWRRKHPDLEPDLRGANLRGANLNRANFLRANLRRADLREAKLFRANLDSAKLLRANLSKAKLSEANLGAAGLVEANLSGGDLSIANLRRAYLNGADLSGADLSRADLRGANLHGVKFVFTNVVDVDLSKANNLENINHYGPSSIGLDTIYRSQGDIPHKFLREAGVPDNFIIYMSSLTGKAFEYFSAFISYTEANEAISKRLYADLQAAGLRIWRWREDAKWGAPIEKNIDQAVRIYDKLIVICSEASLKAPAVIDEIDRALQKEHELMKDGKVPEVLFPITIDDYIFEKWDHYLKPKVMAKTVGDFRGWEDPKKYHAVLERLIAALRQEGNS